MDPSTIAILLGGFLVYMLVKPGTTAAAATTASLTPTPPPAPKIPPLGGGSGGGGPQGSNVVASTPGGAHLTGVGSPNILPLSDLGLYAPVGVSGPEPVLGQDAPDISNGPGPFETLPVLSSLADGPPAPDDGDPALVTPDLDPSVGDGVLSDLLDLNNYTTDTSTVLDSAVDNGDSPIDDTMPVDYTDYSYAYDDSGDWGDL